MEPAAKIGPILQLLDEHYPQVHVTLDFRNPLELLVATILSAQCTDERVNRVTPAIFAKYPSAADYARAPLEELERDIYQTGFYHNKARSLKALGQALVEQHRGQVPVSLEELVKLPGIGRKTANVILGNAFGTPGIVVDTHCGRVSQRLGLTRAKDPVKIEFDLMPWCLRSAGPGFPCNSSGTAGPSAPPGTLNAPVAPCCPIAITARR